MRCFSSFLLLSLILWFAGSLFHPSPFSWALRVRDNTLSPLTTIREDVPLLPSHPHTAFLSAPYSAFEAASVSLKPHTAFLNDLTTGGLPSSHFSCQRTQMSPVYASSSMKSNRKPLIGGNWKCYGNKETAHKIVEFLNAYSTSLGGVNNVEVIVAPSPLHVPYVYEHINKDIQVATQDVSTKLGYGAFTGEVSADAIDDFGLEWCIAGHSERREGFGMQGESNAVVAAKVKNAVSRGLNVIFCIGEKLGERESGETMSVLSEQLLAAHTVLTMEDWKNIVIAYEPVWAIGTGKTATPEIAQETHKFIRDWLKETIGGSVAADTRIIYGGSVKSSNAKDLIIEKDIDGFLVGGASVNSDFIAIIDAALSATESLKATASV